MLASGAYLGLSWQTKSPDRPPVASTDDKEPGPVSLPVEPAPTPPVVPPVTTEVTPDAEAPSVSPSTATSAASATSIDAAAVHVTPMVKPLAAKPVKAMRPSNPRCTDLRTGKLLSKGLAFALPDGVDTTPLAFFRDAPAWSEDPAADDYIKTCQGTKAGDPINPQCLDRVVAFGLERQRLAVKFLIRPGSTAFLADPRPSGPYPVWLRTIARRTSDASRCLDVIGRDDASDALDRRVEFKVIECRG